MILRRGNSVVLALDSQFHDRFRKANSTRRNTANLQARDRRDDHGLSRIPLIGSLTGHYALENQSFKGAMKAKVCPDGNFPWLSQRFADPAPHRACEIFHRCIVPFAFLSKPLDSGLSHSKKKLIIVHSRHGHYPLVIFLQTTILHHHEYQILSLSCYLHLPECNFSPRPLPGSMRNFRRPTSFRADARGSGYH